MNDMSSAIVPKSDQINADDLIGGAMTITILDVQIKGGQEQPVSIYFDGSDKAFRPCKSMSRVLVSAWGADAKKYIGRSLTLFCDPKVKWGGMEVGGIRISHMSDIDSAITMALTVTRANKKPFTVKPIVAGAAPKAAAAQMPEAARQGTDEQSSLATSASSAAPLTDPQILAQIGAHIDKEEWSEARDMARSLKSEVNRKNALKRIGEKESETAIP